MSIDDNDGGELILLPGVSLEADAGDDAVETGTTDAGAPGGALLVLALEAVLFAAEGPQSFDSLRRALSDPSREELREALADLRDDYIDRASGVRLHEVAEGWQLRTAAAAAPWVARSRGTKPVRLSRAAIETVSIVAYRQPVVRQEIERIRGVDSGGILRTLIERGLVKVTGRRDMPGRPLEYGTTRAFLELFGLKDLSDLPTLMDLRELQADDPADGPVPIVDDEGEPLERGARLEAALDEQADADAAGWEDEPPSLAPERSDEPVLLYAALPVPLELQGPGDGGPALD